MRIAKDERKVIEMPESNRTLGLMRQLIDHEGLRLKPYRCTADKLTIGVGRNLDDVGISNGEAIFLLRNDILRVQKELSGHDWYDTLDMIRQDVLVDMCFNLGFTGLMEFEKMIRALTVEDYLEASKQMLDSRWAIQVGRRANKLAKMMEVGDLRNPKKRRMPRLMKHIRGLLARR